MERLDNQFTDQLRTCGHAVLVGHGGQYFFNHMRQVQCQSVCCFRRIELVQLMRPRPVQGIQSFLQSAGEDGFVTTGDQVHISTATIHSGSNRNLIPITATPLFTL